MTTPHETSHKRWGVSVDTSGDLIVRIETECLAGREISEADEDAIRTAAHHLLAFIGDPIPESGNGDGWLPVPDEMTSELIAAATKGKQVLVYDNGRYYNAWLEFDEFEGGWLWMDEADSEPSPSHYRPLPPPPSIRSSDTGRGE